MLGLGAIVLATGILGDEGHAQRAPASGGSRIVLPQIGADGSGQALDVTPLDGVGAIGTRATGSGSVRLSVGANQSLAVELALSSGKSAYIPASGLNRSTTVELRTTAMPSLPKQYVGIEALAVDLGGASLTRGIVVRVPGTPDQVVLHQTSSGDWEEIPARYSGGFLYGYSRDASPFASAKRNSPPQLRTLTGTCFAAGFTGWRQALSSNPPYWDESDNNEDKSTADSYNKASDVAGILQDSGVAYAMWRHYQYNDAFRALKVKAEQGHRIVLVGHSAGGAAALIVAGLLRLQGIPVELFVGLDTFTGPRDDMDTNVRRVVAQAPSWVTFYQHPVPDNVHAAYNAYQRNTWYYWGNEAKRQPGTRSAGEVLLQDADHGRAPGAVRGTAMLKGAFEDACADAKPTPTATPTPTNTPTATPNRPPTATPTRSATPTPTTSSGGGGAPTIYTLGCSPKSVQVNEQVICLSDGTGTVTSLTWTATGGTPSQDSSYSIWFATRFSSPGQKTITLQACNYSACSSRSEVITVGGGPTCPPPSAPAIFWGFPVGNLAGFKWLWSSSPSEGDCRVTHYEIRYGNVVRVITDNFMDAPYADPKCITVIAIGAGGRSPSSTRCY